MDDEFDFNRLAKGSSTRRDFLRISAFSAGAMALAPIINVPFVYAKDLYPSAKIQYLVPQPPGGGYDTIARAMSLYVTKYLQQLTPGAKGGSIVVRNEERKAYPILYNARPDGYTIGFMDATAYVDNLLGEPGVDFTKYTFLQFVCTGDKAVVVNKKGFNSWDEAVNAQKKRTIKMAVGYFARGNHVCAIIVNEKMGTKFKLIPYRGTAESMGALIRGDVDIAFTSADSIRPLIDLKEIKVLLNFSDYSRYPGSANIKELGYPEMCDQISTHRFQIAPPKLAAEPKRLIIEAIKRTCDDPGFKAWSKTVEYKIERVFGDDAEKVFMNLVKFYNEMAPILKKSLA